MALYSPQYKDEQGNIVDLPLNAKKLDGYSYNDYSKYYTTSSTTENAFLVTIPYIKALSDGLVIHCQFHTATKTGATLNVNSLGAKGIYYRYATAITTHILAHNYVDLIYSATIDKWVLLYTYDANSNPLGYQVRTNNGSYYNGADTSCYRYQIVVETNDGLEAFTSTNNSTGTSKAQLYPKYIPNGEIRYYAGTTEVKTKAQFGATSLWQQYQGINLKYSFNIGTITKDSPCYIKMSRNTDGTLSPVYSATSGGHPLVFALPTTKDGCYYTYLGRTYEASSTVYLELELCHPTFYYDCGIRTYDGTYIYDWAKASTKPTYTASEVGALPSDTTYVKSASKNGNTLTITPSSGTALTYTPSFTDTGATSIETTGDGDAVSSASYDASTRKITLTKGATIPTKDSWNYDDRYVKYTATQSLTDTQKTQARTNIGAGTSNFTGYTSTNKLSTDYINNKAGWTANTGTVTSVRVQAGTGLSSSVSSAQTSTLDTTISIASGYKLLTTSEYNALNVQSDWNAGATEGLAYIKNKPYVLPVTNYTNTESKFISAFTKGRYINGSSQTIQLKTETNGIIDWDQGDILSIEGNGGWLLEHWSATEGFQYISGHTGGSNPYFTGVELKTVPRVDSSTDMGDETRPIYVEKKTNALGYTKYVLKTGYTYAGASQVELNGANYQSSKVSFYAPTSAGTSGQFLKSNGSSAPTWATLSTVATSGSYNDLTGVPIPGDSGEIKTKYRCAFKGYTGSGSSIWYYKLVKLPIDNSGNYASAIINGRIGGWVSGNMSSIYCLIWNRDGIGFALLDLGGTGTMSSIFDTADLVAYKNSDNTADIYVKCKGYFTFDLDVEVYQSSASITYDGTHITTTPSGTESGKASTSTSRLQLEKGVLKVNGTDVITSSKSAVDSGTDLSLVTTGEKYTWNNKQDKISYGTNGQLLSSNGSSLVWTNDNRGLLHHDLVKIIESTTTDKGWKMFTDDPENDPINGFFLRSLRFNAQSPSWGVGNFGAGVVFGGGDTKGIMSVSYGNPQIKIAGGNGDYPRWWIGLTGTSATTYDLDELKDKQNKISALGTNVKPIYFSSDGVISDCLNYAGGTKVTLNNTEHKGTTASFYAPTTAGTSGYSLKSNGGSNAPRWANEAYVQLSGSLSSGTHNNASITLVITDTNHPLTKGVWRYSGTYGVFLIFAPTAITTQGSPRTAYICGYSTSISNNASFHLVEV